MEIRFNDYLSERLKDEAFRKEYKAIEREENLKLVRKIIKASRKRIVRIQTRRPHKKEKK